MESNINPDDHDKKDKMNKNESIMGLFIKVGIVVLSILMMIGFGIKIFPGAISVSNSGSKRELPIYCVDTTEKLVALSFDAGSGNDQTEDILAILNKYKVRATFFMTGEWVAKYPDEVKAIAAAGHDLGNHSENHKQMSQLSKEQCTKEIMELHKKVKELTGIEMNLFRAPYGDYNNMLIQTARECDYNTIQWDVDSLDWKDYGTTSIIDTVVNNKHLGNGSIILMHDGAKYTPEALEGIIKGLQKKGYRIVPVSQLIYIGEFAVDSEGKQYRK